MMCRDFKDSILNLDPSLEVSDLRLGRRTESVMVSRSSLRLTHEGINPPYLLSFYRTIRNQNLLTRR